MIIFVVKSGEIIMHQKPYVPEDDPKNRGVTGQDLNDSTNPPGDMHQGTKGSGGDVNMDPKSRDDEGY